MFKSVFASFGDAIDSSIVSVSSLFEDAKEDGPQLDENGLIPPPTVRDTPRTRGREAIVQREAERRNKGLNEKYVEQPPSLEVIEEEEPPEATPREQLSAADAKLLDEIWAKLSQGNDHFTKDMIVKHFGGWDTRNLDFDMMDKDQDGKVTYEEWNAYMQKRYAHMRPMGEDSLNTILVKLLATMEKNGAAGPSQSTAKCVVCGDALEALAGRFSGLCFDVDEGGQIHEECTDSYEDMHAEKCGRCGKALLPLEGVYSGAHLEIGGMNVHEECMTKKERAEHKAML